MQDTEIMQDTQNMQEINRAADLEQSLKEKMDSLPLRRLIKDITVRENSAENSLDVTIVPEGDVFCFGTLHISLNGIKSEKQWKKKKNEVFGNVKGFQPKVNPDFSSKLLGEADSRLHAWREEHPFSEQMTGFLSSREASGFLSAGKISVLRFLAGKESLRHSDTTVTEKNIKIEFKNLPYTLVYRIETGEFSFPLSKASAIYHDLAHVEKAAAVLGGIREYLRQREISSTVRYTGKGSAFLIAFCFDMFTERETVVIDSSYRRIVAAAYKNARERAARKQKELTARLKACPYYGTYLSQAILTTLRENRNRLTEKQIVHLLRGVSIHEDYTFGFYSGKYRLLTAAEIREAVNSLEEAGVVRRDYVQGEYRNYYTFSVTPQGKLFASLQEDAVLKKRPVTEQEYHLVLNAVRDDIPLLPAREREKLLHVIVDKPGIFLTDPKLVLDCVEQMGSPAADYIKQQFAVKEKLTEKDILRLLLNAASGKGKVLPKNGLDAYRERREKERRKKEEAERKDRELFQLVLTEIPDNYIDLYPAARLMHRHFILHIGPTNSGKTHSAVEELMQAGSGIYLAPLRLLAYEQYEKMNRAECPCSLVTGEEQFLIEGAKHQSSTIEMLDLRKHYDVAVIDEAQMIADDARGGAWTAAIMGTCADRIHVCAAPEAENRIVEIIRDCGDEYSITRHKRMTPLVYEKKPFVFPDDVKSGDALIVFSRRSVHAVAAQLRSLHIRCSIIYGALPYDVRHRQAELFAAGKTDVVVATDAIGMGMNLPIRRVVLMETAKYDGFVRRPLNPGEIRQIFGRAGRYGIYNVGYAASANGDERVGKALDGRPRSVKDAVIDFPETLLTIDAPILNLIRKWEQIIPAQGWKKESVEQMHRLAERTEKLNAPKRLAYDFLTIPFEDENDELLRIWYDAFEKEVRGTQYDLYDQVAALAIRKPSSPNAIDELEQQHRVLDLYFNLARKFQPNESTLLFIMEKKRICSERIMKVLEKQGFKAKKCKICGKMLPWNHPYGECSSCYRKGF